MALTDTIKKLFGKRPDDLAALTGPERQDWLTDAADMGAARIDGYCLADRYYDGEHGVKLDDRAKQYLQASGLEYSENFCETIVDTLAERLRVVGFDCADNEDLATWLWDEAWHRTGGDVLQGVVHTETTKLGDGFVFVEFNPDTGRPVARWNRPHNVKPVYATDGTLLHVVKRWETSEVSPTNPEGRPIFRMNIYFPGQVEKWFAIEDGGAWAPHLDLEDATEDGGIVWPIPWTMDGTPEGEPIGIAGVHFANKPQGKQFGRSHLRNVIPQQDALNKQLVDLFYVMDAMGFPQRWGTGIPDSVDLKVAIGEFVTTGNEQARFGQFDAADVVKALDAVEKTMRRMAARSRTPVHLMISSGQLPSGESLKTAMSPLVFTAKDRHTNHGAGWSRVATLMARVTQAFGDLPVSIDDDPMIQPVWDDPQDRNELDETTMLAVHHDLGVSQATILRKLGYDPEEEAKQREKEQPEPVDAPPQPGDRTDLQQDEPQPVQ